MKRKYDPNTSQKFFEFVPPKDANGKEYWVPIVAKNREFLAGYLECYKVLSMMWDIPISEISRTLSSDRFNDILNDDSKIRDLTKAEVKEKLKKMIYEQDKDKEHVENKEELYYDYLLTLDCGGCGMFYSFKEEKELPEHDFHCQTCGRNLITYLYKSDGEFVYSGNKPYLDEMINEVQNEILGENE